MAAAGRELWPPDHRAESQALWRLIPSLDNMGGSRTPPGCFLLKQLCKTLSSVKHTRGLGSLLQGILITPWTGSWRGRTRLRGHEHFGWNEMAQMLLPPAALCSDASGKLSWAMLSNRNIIGVTYVVLNVLVTTKEVGKLYLNNILFNLVYSKYYHFNM